MQRLCSATATLWSGPTRQLAGLAHIVRSRPPARPTAELAKDIQALSSARILLSCGSSLCPSSRMTLCRITHFPTARARLDLPRQVKFLEHADLYSKTLFIVPGNPAATLKPNIFKPVLFERTTPPHTVKSGSHFIAITDSGSKMQQSLSDRPPHLLPPPSIGDSIPALEFGMSPPPHGITQKNFSPSCMMGKHAPKPRPRRQSRRGSRDPRHGRVNGATRSP